MPPRPGNPEIRTASRWEIEECERLLDFGREFPHPAGGAAWLDAHGKPVLGRPVYTWITARMAHVYGLAHLIGYPGARELAEAALDGLRGRLRDRTAGGWLSSIDVDGASPNEKTCYTHAFVVLAAATGSQAGLSGAEALLTEALEVWGDRFFDASEGLFVDSWDRGFTTVSDYRGVNANMHAVEALLASYDTLGQASLLARALRIAERVVLGFAGPHDWRIPEHFSRDWLPLLEHNRDRPDDPFQPFGATVGHGLEWSRLLLHLEAALQEEAPDWLLPAAVALFDQAVSDGWNVDGAQGFVYTTDWSGRPVVHDRMHWVAAEAIAAASVLGRRTADARFDELRLTWIRYIKEWLVDPEHGSWHHQLDATNHPIATVWPGKPDLYHAVQATLLPRLSLAPSLAGAVVRSLDDRDGPPHSHSPVRR